MELGIGNEALVAYEDHPIAGKSTQSAIGAVVAKWWPAEHDRAAVRMLANRRRGLLLDEWNKRHGRRRGIGRRHTQPRRAEKSGPETGAGTQLEQVRTPGKSG